MQFSKDKQPLVIQEVLLTSVYIQKILKIQKKKET